MGERLKKFWRFPGKGIVLGLVWCLLLLALMPPVYRLAVWWWGLWLPLPPT